MSIYNELLNGIGNPEIKWIAIRLIGNETTKKIGTFDNYATALANKLLCKDNNNIILELWHVRKVKKKYKRICFIADDTNMLEAIQELKNYGFYY